MSYLLQFRAARQHIHLGNVHPPDSIRWKLYALAKQATEGDVKTGPPPSSEVVAYAKWQEWNARSGMDIEKAMKEYVQEVEKLDPKFIAANVKESEIKSTISANVVKEGTLFKQRDVFLGWRPRHFVLQDTFLHYFLDANDPVPRNTMVLIGCTVSALPKTAKVGTQEIYPFLISHPKSTVSYFVAAESKQSMDEWIEAIRQSAAKPTSASVTPASIPTNERVLARRPLPVDEEEAKEHPGPVTVNAKDITKGVPPKYAPKIEKAIETMLELTDPACEGWELLFEKSGVKAMKREGSVICVRGEGIIPFPIQEIFRVILDVKRMLELDPQMFSNKKLKTLSINSSVNYMRWKQVWPTAPRDMCNISHWRLLADGTVMVIAFSERFDDICPLVDGVVRAECILGGYVLKQVAGGTDVRYLVQTDLKGTLPSSVANLVASNQPMIIANIKKLLEDESKSSSSPKISFLGNRKQRLVTYEELAYISDDTQPKPQNGLDNLFISDKATIMNEEGVISVNNKDSLKVKNIPNEPLAKVKDIIQTKVKDVTDPAKREPTAEKLSLPMMLLLLLPSALYYGTKQPFVATVLFFVSAAIVLNYVFRFHLGVSVIRTSNSDMSQLANGCMIVRFPVFVEASGKVKRYIHAKNTSSGLDIEIKHIALKAMAAALKDHSDMHGHVILDAFFKSKTPGVDISVTIDVSHEESTTVKVLDANIKGVDYIADELNKRTELLKEGPTLMYSRKARLLSLVPHVTRSYIEWFLSFLGSQLGLSVPALGVVAFPLGAATLVSLTNHDDSKTEPLDNDTDMAMVPIMSGYSSAPITVAIGGSRLLFQFNQEGVLTSKPAVIISVTMDSKVGTLVEMRRFCNTLQKYMNDPSSLDKVDRKTDVLLQDQQIAVEKAKKNAVKYKGIA